jgi:sec-independent protein translocase protein TatB
VGRTFPKGIEEGSKERELQPGIATAGVIQVFVSAMRRQVSYFFMAIPPTVMTANISMADSLILMVMALVVFGPRRLPQIGRQIGKLMYEFRKASNDFKFQMEEELRAADEADRRKREEAERQRQLAENTPAQIEAASSTTTETPAPDPAVEPIDPRDPYAYTYGDLSEEQLRIQPPSTGEPIPANSPTSTASATQEPVETAAIEPATESVAQESTVESGGPAAEDKDKTIESAAKNG